MKIFGCLIVLFAGMHARAQFSQFPPYYIDRAVRSYTESAPAKLLNEIITPYQTEREKVTSIFRWITNNISYNVRAFARRKKGNGWFSDELDDTGRVLKPLNLRVAEMVIQRRTAVCDGYARLFKTMCDLAGIPSEVVLGYARSNFDRGKPRFTSNHTWNAVYIDSSWYLLDATWASGYTNYRGDEFFREYNDRYFLSAPDLFILDHYPEDIAWTMMRNPPTLSEFNQMPFKYSGFAKSNIEAFFPERGIIHAQLGDTLKFEVHTPNVLGLLEVSDTPPVDTIWNDDEPEIIGGRRKFSSYIVTNADVQWLYLTCNGRVILRYRINIRRPPEAVAVASGD